MAIRTLMDCPTHLEVDIADMLMVPEPETENATPVPDEDVQMDAEPVPTPPDANAAPAVVPDQDVVMGGDVNSR